MMGREAARNVSININELVSILHKDHPDWSINRIAHAIWAANEDLDGFSKTTIYDNLNNDNKALLDMTKQNNKKKIVIENSVLTPEQKDIESSSIKEINKNDNNIPPIK